MRWFVLAPCAFALCAAACAANEDSGMAGAPAGPLGIGDVCRGGLPCTAQPGLICSSGGTFDGQCTVVCAGNSGCQVLDARSACLGAQPKQCGIACGTEGAAACPEGTTCTSVIGGMACTAK